MKREERIIESVCSYFEMNMELITKETKRWEIKYPRQILSWFLKKYTNIGYVGVAKLFGQHHTTVMNSVRIIDQLLTADEIVQKDVDNLIKIITKSPFMSVYAIPGMDGRPPLSTVQYRFNGTQKIVRSVIRPPAEYSNSGYLKLMKDLS